METKLVYKSNPAAEEKFRQLMQEAPSYLQEDHDEQTGVKIVGFFITLVITLVISYVLWKIFEYAALY